MGRRRASSTYNEQMRRIYKLYLDAGGAKPARLDVVFDFARKNGLWDPQPADLRKKFCKEMSQALREEYFTDEKGRTVRRNHAVMVPGEDENGNKVKKALWDDIDTAPRGHMEGAFKLRRGQIVGDCQQLKNDVDYFNDNREDEKPIPMLWDFTDDVTEGDLPTEYNPDPEI